MVATVVIAFAVELGDDFKVVRTAGVEGETELPYAALQQLSGPIFGLSERLEFAAIELAIDAISSDDRWERRAARDLAAELSWARIQLCRVALDRSADGTAEIASITPGRERRAADVERLMGDLRTLTSIGLPPLQVTVRALSRLASGV